MGSTLTIKRFDSIDAYVDHRGRTRTGEHVFLLPRWMQTWWHVFKPDDELHLCLMKKDEESIGLVPLSTSGSTASFIGDPEICDHLDFSVTSGFEEEFYHALLDDLAKRDVTELDLRCLRPESTVLSHLVGMARKRGGECSIGSDGVTVEMDLPGDWDEYLNMLDGHQRHEIVRKFRRLHEKGKTQFLRLTDTPEVAKHLDVFMTMFRESRQDKAAFMSDQMESFFRAMIRAMSEEGLVRLYILTLNDASVAAALCFDHNNTMYLYNSGYDPAYSELSVGLLCKALTIRDSIEIGRERYDFLKGAEDYKYRLGGREVPLSRCRIVFN